MAFVAALGPMLAAVGGGSAAAGAATLAVAAVTVYSGVKSAQASKQAGRVTQAESEIAAKAEGDAARQREVERKKNLLRALASQQATAAAAGIRTDIGSTASLMGYDIDESNRDLDTDSTNTLARQRALRFRGRNARAVGDAQATSTLIDTAVRTYQSFGR